MNLVLPEQKQLNLLHQLFVRPARSVSCLTTTIWEEFSPCRVVCVCMPLSRLYTCLPYLVLVYAGIFTLGPGAELSDGGAAVLHSTHWLVEAPAPIIFQSACSTVPTSVPCSSLY